MAKPQEKLSVVVIPFRKPIRIADTRYLIGEVTTCRICNERVAKWRDDQVPFVWCDRCDLEVRQDYLLSVEDGELL